MKELAIIIELLGIVAIAVGTYTEFKFQAPRGHKYILVGSLLLVMGAFIWAKAVPLGLLAN